MGATDTVYGLRILKMLIQPFNQTDAYRLGVIDSKGNVQLEMSKMTSAQKNAYNLLDRIVFALKRLLDRLPGGESQLKNLIAAYYLARESYNRAEETLTEQQLHHIIHLIDSGVVLAEEQLDVEQFLLEDGAGATGGVVSVATTGATLGDGKVNTTDTVGNTQGPFPNKKDVGDYKNKNKRRSGGIARRKSPIDFFNKPAPNTVQHVGYSSLGSTITSRENPMGPVGT